MHPERRRHAVAVEAAHSTSVIVPFHNCLAHLEQCVSALHPLPRHTELVIAADGAIENCRPLAERYGARVVAIAGPLGPAAARNAAAATCTSDVLIFVDADVVVPSAALHAMVREFAVHPDIAGVFGTYDEHPRESNFFSQYKNLMHAYVHLASQREARTFWAGFGGIRAAIFRAMGGFDERFTRPSIEDIELGDRITSAGHRICIDRRLHGCHLKKWTLGTMIASDVWDRGIPWTQLILMSGRFDDALNVSRRARICVALAYAALASLILAPRYPLMSIAAAAAIATTVALNRGEYAFFAARRGTSFAVRAMLAQLLYYFYNGVSFAIGATIHFCRRYLRLHLPGAIPGRHIASGFSSVRGVRL